MSTPTSSASSITIEQVLVPETVDADDARSFLDMVELRNTVVTHLYGRDEFELDAATLLPGYQHSEYDRRLAFLVRQGGVAVARFVLDLPLTEDTHVAMVQLEVHPEFRSRGFGAIASAAAEHAARVAGRTEMRTWVVHHDVEGPRIDSPTGAGSVAANDVAARMLVSRGYELGQAVRFNVLELDARNDPTLLEIRERARAAAGNDYAYVSWNFPTPDEFVDKYAAIKARMSTDAPQGELEEAPQEWDAARIRDVVEAPALEAERRVLVGAIQHVPSGELVAYNELFCNREGTGPTDQEDTLVLREHRGHKLGLLVKAENLVQWRHIAPESPRAYTYNAEENAAMIHVNEQLGYRVFLREGAWKKSLERR
ncbi:GNAT family N-acetyltransferase [Humidisolicoccus flavus]|uniref:GNAT family N-acetyltransferase n=1 Tax=Humidisolicoccus flavus TaxID=3111414 RepID=UPI00324BCA60